MGVLKSDAASVRHVVVGVYGMTCNGCAQRVQAELQQLPGVQAVAVDLAASRAEVTVGAQDPDAESRVAAKVLAMGYAVHPEAPPPPSPPTAQESQQPSTPPPPLRRRSPSLSHVSSVSTCCMSQQSGAGAADEAAPVINVVSRARRYRRGPCGCGGRGCMCAVVPVPDMLTEESRLLGHADTADGPLAQDASVPAAFDRVVAVRQRPQRVTIAKTGLLIEGMSCASCAARIEAKLNQLEGVVNASVNFSTMQGHLTHRLAAASLDRVVRCVAELGYTVTIQSTTAPTDEEEAEAAEARGECTCSTNMRAVPVNVGGVLSAYEHRLLVQGMSCASCAARIEHTLRRHPFVLGCTVSFATGTALVTTHAPSGCAEACKIIQSMGYTVTDTAQLETDSSLNRTREALERTREIADHERNLIGSAILSVPLAAAMVLMMFVDLMDHPLLARVIDGVQLCAATPIVFYYGQSFFWSAWRSWQHGAYTMDSLVAIGTGCTYAYSAVVYLLTLFVYPNMHMMTYFDTAGMLTTFMLLGRFLEARAKRSTSGALIELMSLVPPTAVCVQPDGSEVRVSSSQLQRGALVRVLAGDRVPVDGTIVEGSSELDEQMVTGESLPKLKKPGEAVVGGTLNITAALLIRADKVGEETMIAQVLRIVQEAQTTKPAVQRAADRIAMSFVPAVLLFSLLTLFVWLLLGLCDAYPTAWRGHGTSWQAFAFNFFISTVVAACPCALGLATPTAIMVGTGVGSQNGVLVKSGTTLEAVRRVDSVVLDKTGTITKGRLGVVRSCVAPVLPEGVDAAMTRRLVGLVEARSNHPIAQAVCAALLPERDDGDHAAPAHRRRTHYSVGSVVTHGGKGVEATVTVSHDAADAGDAAEGPGAALPPAATHSLLVGNLALLREHRVPLPPQLAHLVEEENSRGLTTVVASINGVACVVVSLADEPKPEARGVVQFLRKAGVRVFMVTGDSAGVATRIASEVGIDQGDVRAEALPVTKATIVRELQAKGCRVMFVGDGINDSPALAQANVGVALGAGTEVAIEAADAVLVRNSLVDLLNLRSLSNTTVRRIYGNFIWAFGYNMLMLPMASGLLYPFFRVQLPPVVAGAAMMLSSLSVLSSSLSIRCFRPHRERDFVGR